MIAALFEYQFLQNAVWASLLASIVCGIMGVIIVEKKLVMMSGGIAHTSYGGVGLGYLLGFEPILGAFVISLLAALGIAYIKRHGGTHSDVVIGLFWSMGMALGILFIGLAPGYPPDLTSYLFGNILSVTQSDLVWMLLLSVIVMVIVISFFSYWKSYLFDDEFATIVGIKTSFLEYLLFILIAMAVVVLIRVVGIVLVLALFTAPTAVASLVSKQLSERMVWATFFGIFFSLMGLMISYQLNISSGAAIVLVASLVYLLAYVGVVLSKMKCRE